MGLEHIKYHLNNKDKIKTDLSIKRDSYQENYLKYKNDPEYRRFFNDLIIASQALIKQYFPGIEVECHGRIKSEKSFNGKVEKKLKNLNNYYNGLIEPKDLEDQIIYDIYGFRTVVKNVSENYNAKSDDTKRAQDSLKQIQEQFNDALERVENAKNRYEQLSLSIPNIESDKSKEDASIVATMQTIQTSIDTLEKQYEEAQLAYKQSEEEYFSTLETINSIEDEEKSSKLRTLLETNLKYAKTNMQDLNENLKSAKINLAKYNQILADSRTGYNVEKENNEETLRLAKEELANSKSSLEIVKHSVQMAQDTLNIAVSAEIADFFTAENSPLLEKLSAKHVELRRKDYNKDNGYIANQRTFSFLGKEAPIYIEWQGRSKYRDELAHENHNEYKGADLDFPKEEFLACETQEDIQKLLEVVPTYIVPTSDGSVKMLSPIANFLYYYNDFLYQKDENGDLLHNDVLEKLESLPPEVFEAKSLQQEIVDT